MNHRVLVTGGCRSGKSRYAVKLAESAQRPCLIATAQPLDEEMKQRIARHQQERDDRWHTFEEPLYLSHAIQQTADFDFWLIDCLTLWTTNWLLHIDGHADLREDDFWTEVTKFADAVANQSGPVVIVTNEVGLGIVPDNALARQFRDWAGLVNQRIAAVVDEVILMVAGLPLRVKEARR